MFDKARYRMTLNEIAVKVAGGFKYSPPPLHCVYSNFYTTGRKWRAGFRESWYVDPTKLSLFDSTEVMSDFHFIPPFAEIYITEGQDYFDSRAYKNFKRCQSSFFEQHGHMGYDIYIDVQRYGLIDKNIRDLAGVIEIQSKESIRNIFGRVVATKWIIREFESCHLYEQYLMSGKRLSNYIQIEEVADYDVHRNYNSRLCEPKFYQGNLSRDFDREVNRPPRQTIQGYNEYYQRQYLRKGGYYEDV
jgi:hypothetical protein